VPPPTELVVLVVVVAEDVVLVPIPPEKADALPTPRLTPPATIANSSSVSSMSSGIGFLPLTLVKTDIRM